MPVETVSHSGRRVVGETILLAAWSKTMRNFAFALILAAPSLVASSSVRAADTSCTGPLTGTISGNILVPSGASCTLSDVTVTGNVHVLQNASLTVDATQQPATIGGNIQATNC